MPDQPTIFEQLGGEPGVARIVARFYDSMDRRADAATIRALHPADLTAARNKLTWFLIGWTGGPPAYVSRYGHPRLRARHLPFAIDTAAAAAWMTCMDEALAAEVADDALRASLHDALVRLATHMRNQPDEST